MLYVRRKYPLSSMLAASLIVSFTLSGCETASKAWDSTTNTVGGLFSSDDAEEAQTADAAAGEAPAAETPAAAPATGTLTAGTMPGAGPATGRFVGASTSTRAPNLADVPTEAPVPPSTQKERNEAKEGLIADRERSQYTDQPGRREPVTVRPLSASAQAAPATPPVPQAAPTQSVTRIDTPPAAAPARAAAQTGAQTAAAAPAAPSEPVAPRTTALAERLGATPPPPPPPEAGSAPAAAPAPQPLRPSSPPIAAAPATMAPLVPMPPATNPYGDDTVVIDGSGVSGGGQYAPQQMATAPVAPRASFDPGSASVSSQVGTIAFAPGSNALDPNSRAVLKEVADLRKTVDGAVRVEIHGPSNPQRASAITAELKRLGVPAARLYTGSGMTFGDEADIYLDY